MIARLGVALHWVCMLVGALAIALAVYMQFALAKLDAFQQLIVWCSYGFAVLAWLLGYGLRYVLAGDLSQRTNHVHEFVERFADTRTPVRPSAVSRPRPTLAAVGASVPHVGRNSSATERARATAQQILETFTESDAGRDYFAEFVVSAAKAVLSDAHTAEQVGRRLSPWR